MRLLDRHARAAEERLIDGLRRALSCLTTTILVPRPRTHQPLSRSIELARNPTPLRGELGLSLQFFHTYTVQPSTDTGEWELATAAYRYELYDRDVAEILAYHWHPVGRSPVAFPHLHVTARHPAISLAKRHLPTGLVPVQTFLRSLITEFGVEPLRPDWHTILGDT